MDKGGAKAERGYPGPTRGTQQQEHAQSNDHQRQETKRTTTADYNRDKTTDKAITTQYSPFWWFARYGVFKSEFNRGRSFSLLADSVAVDVGSSQWVDDNGLHSTIDVQV